MRLGIVSDTHGNTDVLREIAAIAQGVEYWLHAGDNYHDAAFLARLTNTPVSAVTGNCDYRYPGLPEEEVLFLGGSKILLTHGHRYGVKQGTDGLVRAGRGRGADIVVFGHTHVSLNIKKEGLLLFNPGSPSCPRGQGGPSFGVIRIGGGIWAEVVGLG